MTAHAQARRGNQAHSGWQWSALLTLLLLGVITPAQAQETTPAPAAAPASSAPAAAAENPLPLSMDKVFQAGDRVLFVGDELTQQMFFTRAVAAAVLPLRPKLDLRFFNGGRDGATATSTRKWVDDVMKPADPTVVFICLGLNDAPTPPLTQEVLTQYQRDLAALVDHVRQSPKVRLVVLMSPPAIERGMAAELAPDNPNHVLATLGEGARVVAARRQAGFIDLYEHISRVYLGQVQSGATDPVSLGGRLPNEVGHMVLASSVLAAVGVKGADLDAIGWSPLLPREMARVRGALAVKSNAPDLGRAQASRALYLQLFRFDEQFFRLWRLAGRKRSSSPDPTQVTAQAEEAWLAVRQMVGTTP